ncbi:MAG: hypothetical protein MHM6MM_008119, partial [Cercozoa sp. M6MM]
MMPSSVLVPCSIVVLLYVLPRILGWIVTRVLRFVFGRRLRVRLSETGGASVRATIGAVSWRPSFSHPFTLTVENVCCQVSFMDRSHFDWASLSTLSQVLQNLPSQPQMPAFLRGLCCRATASPRMRSLAARAACFLLARVSVQLRQVQLAVRFASAERHVASLSDDTRACGGTVDTENAAGVSLCVLLRQVRLHVANARSHVRLTVQVLPVTVSLKGVSARTSSTGTHRRQTLAEFGRTDLQLHLPLGSPPGPRGRASSDLAPTLPEHGIPAGHTRIDVSHGDTRVFVSPFLARAVSAALASIPDCSEVQALMAGDGGDQSGHVLTGRSDGDTEGDSDGDTEGETPVVTWSVDCRSLSADVFESDASAAAAAALHGDLVRVVSLAGAADD